MAYLIKVMENLTYWSGKEDSVWVNQSSEAKSYATKSAAEKSIKEVSEISGYTKLEVVNTSDALSVQIPVVDEVVLGYDASLTVEQQRQLAS